MMSDMETSIRGFSFMPGTEAKFKGLDLQYVEDSELERAWRSSRRERVKLQEDKIWNEFIEEQDIVKTVYESDPYQFIEQLSESCLDELMQNHLNKVQQKEKKTGDEANGRQEAASPDEDSPVSTESADHDGDDDNIFHLFHEDKDDEGCSGNEDILNDSACSPLCTVREKQEEIEEQIIETKRIPEKDTCNAATSQSTINSVLENSIYCAKVKDLRVRISEEILSIITSLERLDVYNIDPEEIKKIQKRSAEFHSRFSRIHVYQLQRQIQELKRTSTSQLPYGQHTQLQALMLRIVSLHQNLLQAYCSFHKSFSQTTCIGEGAQAGLLLGRLVRDIPPAHPALRHLYADNLVMTCDKLDEALAQHNQRTVDFIKSVEDDRNGNKTQRGRSKKFSGVKTSSRADGKLSMYSLDTLRINLKPKSSSTKNSSLSSANKLTSTASKTSQKQVPKRVSSPKPKRRSPIKVRPKRDDTDVRTMVEAVTASHVSLVPSALPSPTKAQASRKIPTPRPKRIETSRRNQKKKPIEVKTKIESSRSEREIAIDSPKEVLRSAVSPVAMTRDVPDTSRNEKKYKIPDAELASAEVSRLLRELCGDTSGNKNERVSGAKNAQLHCVRTESPRQHTTPQLLRILEETIQKKSPRSMNVRLSTIKDKEAEKYRMSFNISQKAVDHLFQYRTKYVQHMLTSAMYANSAMEKPWEMVNSVSDQIVDELLLKCAKEMELRPVIQRLYQNETKG